MVQNLRKALDLLGKIDDLTVELIDVEIYHKIINDTDKLATTIQKELAWRERTLQREYNERINQCANS